jgi:type IV pilus assembly protein PilN
MMMRINLLPHRQLKRAERQRQFGLMALLAAVAASAIVFAGWTYLGAKKQAQLERNNRLEQAITQLDKEIADIKDLKDQINNVLERKQVVENLQTNRSQAVVVLDEITRQLPEGLYLKSIKQTGNLITLEGVADTNARVATLVRNLGVSNWMESPNLVEIKTSTLNGIKQNDFTMTVNLKVQKAEEAPAKKKMIGVKP